MKSTTEVMKIYNPVWNYQCACKAVEFGRFVTTGNDELDMIKTNITANISKARHDLGEYSFI